VQILRIGSMPWVIFRELNYNYCTISEGKECGILLLQACDYADFVMCNKHALDI